MTYIINLYDIKYYFGNGESKGILMTEEFEEGNRKKIALLIDGDNAQPGLIEKMLAETGKYGQITIRRIYGYSP